MMLSDRQYFTGLCIDVRTCKLIPLELIIFNLDFVLMYMFMSAMYCVCMHTFHPTHIYMVFNSVKCVHIFIIKLILELLRICHIVKIYSPFYV